MILANQLFKSTWKQPELEAFSGKKKEKKAVV
jgi:hypothetical protein